MNIIIILLIIVLVLVLVYLSKTIENFEDVTKINPIIELAKTITLLDSTKKENETIKLDTEKLQTKISDLEKQIDNLNSTIKDKNDVKLKLESDIAEIEKQKALTAAVATVVKTSIDKTIQKEEELKKKEEDLGKKEMDVKELSKIKDNLQLTSILNLLNGISKDLNKDKEFCDVTKEMPKVVEFKTYAANEKDLSYTWCMCNDDNKKTKDCNNYLSCKDNYDKNKDTKNLQGDDLEKYFSCISTYPEIFPKYLTAK